MMTLKLKNDFTVKEYSAAYPYRALRFNEFTPSLPSGTHSPI
jgi:hypothetical protein